MHPGNWKKMHIKSCYRVTTAVMFEDVTAKKAETIMSLTGISASCIGFSCSFLRLSFECWFASQLEDACGFNLRLSMFIKCVCCREIFVVSIETFFVNFHEAIPR